MSLRAKRHDRTGGPVFLPSLDKTSDVPSFKIFLLLQLDRLQLSAPNASVAGKCKDNTSQVHFRSVNLYKEFSYRSESE